MQVLRVSWLSRGPIAIAGSAAGGRQDGAYTFCSGGRTIRCSHYSSSSSPVLFSLSSSSSSSEWPCSDDLDEYFLNGSDWRKAPKLLDHIGPVHIARTSDGRGRGLYASKAVNTGDLLLMSKAFAASYNGTDSIELYHKIASILEQSPLALRQYYSLAGGQREDAVDAPPVNLFDANSTCADNDSEKTLEFDEERVAHILNVNSFNGLISDPRDKDEVRLNALWLLPSFINHSCHPNAGRLVVGETMIIFAAQNIRAKQEITIDYTDCMAPLKTREKKLNVKGGGFHCQCKRCTVERSVQGQLQEISDRYHALYDKAVDEVMFVVSTREKAPAPACKELAEIYQSLQKKVSTFDNLTRIEKQWILGGYSCAFLGNWLTIGHSTDFAQPSNLVPHTAVELVQAMKATIPGMLRTLSFATLLATIAQKQEDQLDLVPKLLDMAMDECIRLYGKRRPDVIIKLMEESASIVPFF